MKRYTVFAYIFFHCFLVQSQEDIASISPENNRFSTGLLEDAGQQPGNYLYLPLKDYTASSLFYNFEDGKYKQGAVPEGIQSFGVKTSGISRSDKGIVFFGDFSIEKSYYRDLKWNLSYQLPAHGLMPDPHYFGVSKAGNWSNQEYHINGGMFLPLIQDRLYLLANFNYELFNKYRTDLDPRPKITYNELGFHGGLNYGLSRKHHLKIGGRYGYTHVQNEIDFSNNDQNLPVNHDIYVRWVAGYGSLISPLENSTLRRNTEQGFDLGYAYTSDRNTLLADLSYLQKNQKTYREGDIKDTGNPTGYFANYEPEQLQLRITGIHQLAEGTYLKAVVSAETTKAENYLFSKSGKTYAAEKNFLQLDLGYLQQNGGHTRWDLGTRMELWQVEQQDALAATSSSYSNAELEFYASRSFQINPSLRLNPFAEAGIRYALQSELINGNGQYLENIAPNDFSGQSLRNYYKELLLPDFALFSQHAFDFSAGAGFLYQPSEKIKTLLNLETGMASPLESIEYFGQESSRRFRVSISLTMFY